MVTVGQLQTITKKIRSGQTLSPREQYLYQTQQERIQREVAKQREQTEVQRQAEVREAEDYYWVGARRFSKKEYEMVGHDDDTPETFVIRHKKQTYKSYSVGKDSEYASYYPHKLEFKERKLVKETHYQTTPTYKYQKAVIPQKEIIYSPTGRTEKYYKSKGINPELVRTAKFEGEQYVGGEAWEPSQYRNPYWQVRQRLRAGEKIPEYLEKEIRPELMETLVEQETGLKSLQQYEKAKAMTVRAQIAEWGRVVVEPMRTEFEREAAVRGLTEFQLEKAAVLTQKARKEEFGEMVGGMTQKEYEAYQKARKKEEEWKKIREYPAYYFPSKFTEEEQKAIKEGRMPKPITYFQPKVEEKMKLALYPPSELKEIKPLEGKYAKFLYTTRKKLETFELGREAKIVTVGGEEREVLVPKDGVIPELKGGAAGITSALLYPIRTGEEAKELGVTATKGLGFGLALGAVGAVTGPVGPALVIAGTGVVGATQVPELQVQMEEARLMGPVASREMIVEVGLHAGVAIGAGYLGSLAIPKTMKFYTAQKEKLFLKKMAVEGDYIWYKEGVAKRPLTTYEKTLVESRSISPRQKAVIFERAGGKVATTKTALFKDQYGLTKQYVQTQLYPERRIITKPPAQQTLKVSVYRDYWKPEWGVRSYLGKYMKIPAQAKIPKPKIEVIDIKTGRVIEFDISPTPSKKIVPTRQVKLVSEYGDMYFGKGYVKEIIVPTKPTFVSKVKEIKLRMPSKLIISGKKAQLTMSPKTIFKPQERIWKFEPLIQSEPTTIKPTTEMVTPKTVLGRPSGYTFAFMPISKLEGLTRKSTLSAILTRSMTTQSILAKQVTTLLILQAQIPFQLQAQATKQLQMTEQIQLQAQATKQLQMTEQILKTEQIYEMPLFRIPRLRRPPVKEVPPEPIITPPSGILFELPRFGKRRQIGMEDFFKAKPIIGRYAASLVGVEQFRKFGTIGKEPKFVGLGIRPVTRGMALTAGRLGGLVGITTMRRKSKKGKKTKRKKGVFEL